MYDPIRTIEFIRDMNAVIGSENLKRLCAHYGGASLYIPTLRHLERPFRDQQIWADACQGVPVHRLCQRYGLSDRQIRRILRTQRTQDTSVPPRA